MSRRARLVLAVAFALLPEAAGCSRNADDRAADIRKEVMSWSATVQLINDLQRRGGAPHFYVEQTLDAALKELGKQRKEASELPAGSMLRQGLEGQIDELERRVHDLQGSSAQASRPHANDLLAASIPGAS